MNNIMVLCKGHLSVTISSSDDRLTLSILPTDIVQNVS